LIPLFSDGSDKSVNKIITFSAAIVTMLSVGISAYYYISDRPSRERDVIYSAWQIVSSMEGKKGGGGRERALDQLKNHNEELSGINLNLCYLQSIDLSGVKLFGGSFIGSNISQINFNNSFLSKTCFNFSRLHRSQFINSTLDSINFKCAIITDANFDDARIKKCIGDSLTTFNGSSFNYAIISYSKFIDSNFDNAHFNEAKLIFVILNYSQMKRCHLDNAVFRHVEGKEVNLSPSEAINLTIDANSDFSGAKFEGAEIKFSNFKNTKLCGASFFNTILTGTTFENSDLSKVDFSSATLKDVKFINCYINDADFSMAKEITTLDTINCSGHPKHLQLANTN
jgi:uncharacterized protein YjbI with pentapeptide repeats